MIEDMGQDDETLLREAADLMIRAQGPAADPAVQDELQGWRARSERHEEIWRATCRMWGLAASVGPGMPLASPVSRPEPRRVFTWRHLRSRKWAGWGLGIAAALTALLVSPLPLMLQADYRTDMGARQSIVLADGSQVTLDRDSAIAVDYAPAERHVTLLKGRAWFDVAHNAARPFKVAAADVTVRVTGTAFDVDRGDHGVDVALARGSVTASWTVSGSTQVRHLIPGQRLMVDGTSHQGRLQPIPVSSVAAWRRDRLLADGITLQRAVDELSRSFGGRILVIGANLQQQRVTGAYDTSDPAQALSLLVQPFGGHVRHITPWLLIVSAS
ncbi:FecR family protein [Novosphingobium terrae]|uniref:FecR family protein n=1 Tax=Novosphingobium terrae TaxID=2726189 RepID=UPI00198107B7|nr:FecR family protein [Novosphingobium terrae]